MSLLGCRGGGITLKDGLIRLSVRAWDFLLPLGTVGEARHGAPIAERCSPPRQVVSAHFPPYKNGGHRGEQQKPGIARSAGLPYLPLPAAQVKLFNKYTFEDVQVNDIALVVRPSPSPPQGSTGVDGEAKQTEQRDRAR